MPRQPLLLKDDFLELAEKRFLDSASDEDTVWEKRLAALQRCLGKLSNADRDLVRRRYAAREKVKEIAQRMAINPNAMSKKLERIRALLRNCIDAVIKGNET